jgi:hypothetical protein
MAESTERRTQTRIAWRGSLRLGMIDGREIVAAIRDISTGGFGLWTDEAVAAGVRVTVLGEGFQGEATVQYCEPQGARYRVGLALVGANAR